MVKSLICSAIVAFLSFGAVAIAQEATRTLVMNRDGVVGGQVISKGSYQIKFAADKDGELVLMRGKRELARAPYRIEKLDEPARQTIVVYRAVGDGSVRVARIEFKGSSTALLVE